MTHALQMRLSTVGIVVGFAVLIAILALAHRNIRDMTAAIEWRQHTHEVIAEIRALLAHAVDAETNMRGFVITGDERFLDPQTKAAGELPGSVAALRRLTSDNPSQRARLGRVEELVQQRLRSMAERIHQRREQGVSAAAAASLEGKHITDALRQALQEMEGAEQSLLAEREAAVRAEASRVDLTLLAGAVVSLVLLAGSFVGLHREVRQRRTAEESLRRQTAVLQSVLDSMEDGVTVADSEGRFLLFNRGGERILGAGAVEGGPAEWSERYGVFHLDGTTRLSQDELPLVQALRGQTVRDVEILIRNPKLRSDVIISVNAAPLPDAEGRPAGGVAVFRDITERKRSELELRAARDAAEAAARELEAFSYSVSHDLRAPLRGMDGFSQALLEDYAERLDDEGKEYLRRIRAGAQRMGQLIDDLLKLSRISRTELSVGPVDVSALARSVTDEVRGRDPERSASISVRDGLLDQADPRLLRIALENLLSNAWKFTRRRAEAVIEFGADATNGRPAVYYVKDNGAGFEMAYADKLFGAFQRLHSAKDFEGTGIGLATVARVIARHGGRLWAEGAPEKGATFYFTLGSDAPGSREV